MITVLPRGAEVFTNSTKTFFAARLRRLKEKACEYCTSLLSCRFADEIPDDVVEEPMAPCHTRSSQAKSKVLYRLFKGKLSC